MLTHLYLQLQLELQMQLQMWMLAHLLLHLHVHVHVHVHMHILSVWASAGTADTRASNRDGRPTQELAGDQPKNWQGSQEN